MFFSVLSQLAQDKPPGGTIRAPRQHRTPSEGGGGVEQDRPETDAPHQKEPQDRSDAT